jgi:hypothetical protein
MNNLRLLKKSVLYTTICLFGCMVFSAGVVAAEPKVIKWRVQDTFAAGIALSWKGAFYLLLLNQSACKRI